MKELKLGKMTNKELMEWFDTTSSSRSFSANKKRYLKKLKDYAEFEVVHGGVKITRIICPFYIKDQEANAKEYLRIVNETPDQLTSITAIVEKMQTQEPYKNMSFETLKYRMTLAGKLAFGITAEEESKGLYGNRHYIWAIKTYEVDRPYRYLTKVEKELFDYYTENIYKENIDRVQKEALLEKEYQESDTMSKEEYFAKKEAAGLNVFQDVLHAFKKHTGEQIVRATQHEVEMCYRESAFEMMTDVKLTEEEKKDFLVKTGISEKELSILFYAYEQGEDVSEELAQFRAALNEYKNSKSSEVSC
jgi:hypothetical protein